MSILKIKGTLGGLNFYTSPDGYLVRETPGVSKERMRTDPNLVRARENGWEFGIAARAGKMMRQAFSAITADVSDRLVSSRMQTSLLRVLQSDPESKRGERQVTNGNLRLLKGFNFNIKSNFDNVFHGNYHAALNRETDLASLTVPKFSPVELLGSPKNATHFRFTLATAEVDFATGNSRLGNSSTSMLPLGQHCPEIALQAVLPAGSDLPQFLLVKITFYQEQGGQMFMMKNGKYAAATILEVDYVNTAEFYNLRMGNAESSSIILEQARVDKYESRMNTSSGNFSNQLKYSLKNSTPERGP